MFLVVASESTMSARVSWNRGGAPVQGAKTIGPSYVLRVTRPAACADHSTIEPTDELKLRRRQVVILAIGLKITQAQLADCEKTLATCSEQGGREYTVRQNSVDECDECANDPDFNPRSRACRRCARKRAKRAELMKQVDDALAQGVALQQQITGYVRRSPMTRDNTNNTGGKGTNNNEVNSSDSFT